MGILDFSLLDVWNHPVLKITRGAVKLAAKGISTANAKAESNEIATPELTEIINEAKKGDSNSQCALALYYAEKQEFEKATYWLDKSAEQGNEYALEIQDLLQEE